jgi:hypothetical protein
MVDEYKKLTTFVFTRHCRYTGHSTCAFLVSPCRARVHAHGAESFGIRLSAARARKVQRSRGTKGQPVVKLEVTTIFLGCVFYIAADVTPFSRRASRAIKMEDDR